MSDIEEKLKLFTRFEIQENRYLELDSKLFFIGSCFAENIGERLESAGFDTLSNPFGILYNPVSIKNAILCIVEKRAYSEGDLVQNQNNYVSLDHHGQFSGSTPAFLLEKINQNIATAHYFLQNADVAFITLGTAFCYFHTTSQKIVANCHKIPGKEFQKILLSESEILDNLEAMYAALRSLNPAIKVCFTLSPVKHLRDGITENALSKARLLSAIHAFIASKNDEKTDYFPAFEIMQEELRDHRFYAEDLAHPNVWSTDYIFSRFVRSRLTERGQSYLNRFQQFLRMESHRPRTTDNAELTAWADKKREFLAALAAEFPEKSFDFILNPVSRVFPQP